MQFRHEWKHEISHTDMLILRERLSAVMKRDIHAIDGKYKIRSLYFDSMENKALREKLDGVSRREKFRMRFYNDDTSFIHLEKKSKLSGLGRKDSVTVTKEEAQMILDGELDFMKDNTRPLLYELYAKMKYQGLAPKTVVDYTREPFTFAPGNVRVTLDYNIRSGLHRTDFLDPSLPTISVPGDPCILEVKWDEFLPDIIRHAVNIDGRRTSAFSKYAICRVFDF